MGLFLVYFPGKLHKETLCFFLWCRNGKQYASLRNHSGAFFVYNTTRKSGAGTAHRTQKGVPCMKRLLIRADDLGYSQGVNCGIAATVAAGLVRSVGVMTNMPDAVHGLGLLAGHPVCLGQHTNICVGRPLTDPARIPSLCTPEGGVQTQPRLPGRRQGRGGFRGAGGGRGGDRGPVPAVQGPDRAGTRLL